MENAVFSYQFITMAIHVKLLRKTKMPTDVALELVSFSWKTMSVVMPVQKALMIGLLLFKMIEIKLDFVYLYTNQLAQRNCKIVKSNSSECIGHTDFKPLVFLWVIFKFKC